MKWEDYGESLYQCVAKYKNHPKQLSGWKDTECIIRLYAGSGASLRGHNKFAKVKILSDFRRGELHIWPSAYIEDDVCDVEIISNNYRIPEGYKMTIGYHQIFGPLYKETIWNDINGWMVGNTYK